MEPKSRKSAIFYASSKCCAMLRRLGMSPDYAGIAVLVDQATAAGQLPRSSAAQPGRSMQSPFPKTQPTGHCPKSLRRSSTRAVNIISDRSGSSGILHAITTSESQTKACRVFCATTVLAACYAKCASENTVPSETTSRCLVIISRWTANSPLASVKSGLITD